MVLMVFFSSQNFAAHIDGDLAREVAASNRGGHLGDVANLVRQVRCHEVHRIGEVLPGARDSAHLRLAAELAFRTDFRATRVTSRRTR